MKKSTLPADILRYARDMRHQATDAESLMWLHLRNRRMGGFKFRRQHPLGRYILDFYCVDAQLAIELDGGQHSEQRAFDYDHQRTIWINQQGITVLRFWNHDVLQNTIDVLEQIWQHLPFSLTESTQSKL